MGCVTKTLISWHLMEKRLKQNQIHKINDCLTLRFLIKLYQMVKMKKHTELFESPLSPIFFN